MSHIEEAIVLVTLQNGNEIGNYSEEVCCTGHARSAEVSDAAITTDEDSNQPEIRLASGIFEEQGDITEDEDKTDEVNYQNADKISNDNYDKTDVELNERPRHVKDQVMESKRLGNDKNDNDAIKLTKFSIQDASNFNFQLAQVENKETPYKKAAQHIGAHSQMSDQPELKRLATTVKVLKRVESVPDRTIGTFAKTGVTSNIKTSDAVNLSVPDGVKEINDTNSKQTKHGKEIIQVQETTSPDQISKNDNPVLLIQRLSKLARAADLKCKFREHAKVLRVKIMSSTRNLEADRLAHITVATAEDASKCIDSLHNTEFQGQFITVTLLKKAFAFASPGKLSENGEGAEIDSKSISSSVNEVDSGIPPSSCSNNEIALDVTNLDMDSGIDNTPYTPQVEVVPQVCRDVDMRILFEQKVDEGRRSSDNQVRDHDPGTVSPTLNSGFHHREKVSYKRRFSPIHRRVDNPDNGLSYERNYKPQRMSRNEIQRTEVERNRRHEFRHRSADSEEAEERKQRKIERRNRIELREIELEKDRLRREREKIEQEKEELIRLEKLRQEREREEIEREKAYLERAKIKLSLKRSAELLEDNQSPSFPRNSDSSHMTNQRVQRMNSPTSHSKRNRIVHVADSKHSKGNHSRSSGKNSRDERMTTPPPRRRERTEISERPKGPDLRERLVEKKNYREELRTSENGNRVVFDAGSLTRHMNFPAFAQSQTNQRHFAFGNPTFQQLGSGDSLLSREVPLNNFAHSHPREIQTDVQSWVDSSALPCTQFVPENAWLSQRTSELWQPNIPTSNELFTVPEGLVLHGGNRLVQPGNWTSRVNTSTYAPQTIGNEFVHPSFPSMEAHNGNHTFQLHGQGKGREVASIWTAKYVSNLQDNHNGNGNNGISRKKKGFTNLNKFKSSHPNLRYFN